MTSLPERLRHEAEYGNAIGWPSAMLEAADEIERLNATIVDLQHLVREERHRADDERAKFLNEKALRERDRART